MKSSTKSAIVLGSALAVLLGWIAFLLLRTETVHVRLLGEGNRHEFSFYVNWPKTSGARIEVADVGGKSLGRIEINISDNGRVLQTFAHDVTESDRRITLEASGKIGYEVAIMPRGVLSPGKRYLVSGTFSGGQAEKYSLWLCYVAPWRFGIED